MSEQANGQIANSVSTGNCLTRVLSHPKTAELVGIDVRALAALRIGLALILLFDLARRVPYITAHYSDQGVMPAAELAWMSVHALNGSPLFTMVLFAFATVFALMLLVGYHTWVATVLSWILLASLQKRNLLLNNSGDHLLCLLLFWGMFLPLGASASVDSRISKPPGAVPRMILRMGSVALLLQVICVYVFSAISKNHSVWVTQGLGIYNTLNLDAYARPAGKALLQLRTLVKVLSPITYWFELFGPLLAFVPFLTPWFRAITVLLFIGFHLCLQMSLELNLFSYVCIVMWLIYLPQGWWDWLASLPPAAAVSRWGGSVVDRLVRRVESPWRKLRWLLPPPDDGRATLVGNVLAAVLVVYVLAWNIGSVWEPARMPPALARPGAQLAIGQKWVMFSKPPLDDGWWVMPARLRDGSEVDLFKKGGPVNWEKPPSVLKTFSTPRWRRYLEDVWNKPQVRHHVVHYAAWLRRHWNGRHPPQEQIESMRIHYMIEMTRPDYRPPIRSNQVIYEWCSSGDERFSTYLEAIRAFAQEVSDDPTILPDILRGAGLEESFLNE